MPSSRPEWQPLTGCQTANWGHSYWVWRCVWPPFPRGTMVLLAPSRLLSTWTQSNPYNYGSSAFPSILETSLLNLQTKFGEIEALGVFARPEHVGTCITVEYLNPSSLDTTFDNARYQKTGQQTVGHILRKRRMGVFAVCDEIRTRR